MSPVAPRHALRTPVKPRRGRWPASVDARIRRTPSATPADTRPFVLLAGANRTCARPVLHPVRGAPTVPEPQREFTQAYRKDTILPVQQVMQEKTFGLLYEESCKGNQANLQVLHEITEKEFARIIYSEGEEIKSIRLLLDNGEWKVDITPPLNGEGIL